MAQLLDNEPVAIGGVVAILTALLTPILARVGINADGVASIVAYAGTVVSAAIAVWSIIRARSKVTPVAQAA